MVYEKSKIQLLQEKIAEHKLEAYIISSVDEFQNQYTSPANNRLKYVTGFSGSNGLLVIGQNSLLFFTDGRYLEQASKELAPNFEIIDIANLEDFPWQNYHTKQGLVGYDARVFTSAQLKRFAKLQLQAIWSNLVDEIWHSKPEEESGQIVIYPLKYSGKPAIEKIQKCISQLPEQSACLLTDTAAICWMLNLRDISARSHIGMFNCYLIIAANGHMLFSDELAQDRQQLEIIQYLAQLNVKIMPLSALENTLSASDAKHIAIDPASCSVFFLDLIGSKALSLIPEYSLAKAIKNSAEIMGAQNAHIKDAAALCEFFAWLDQQQLDQKLDQKKLSPIFEHDLADKIISFRSKQEGYIKESFPAICGFGSNGSIIHYRAQAGSSKEIGGSGLLLVDSGAHYFGGTTDVTRVICLGQPTQQQCRFYTLVLKGHIAVANLIFKRGCTGANIDVLARMHLWQEYQDYAHSTGHGVGNMLSVHEGPCAISSRNQTKLSEGMILSNEPGYYAKDKFGIRIENLMLVLQTENKDFLKFDTLTLIPFSAKLIISNMLNLDEKNWIISYYNKIESVIRPLLTNTAKKWLDQELRIIKL